MTKTVEPGVKPDVELTVEPDAKSDASSDLGSDPTSDFSDSSSFILAGIRGQIEKRHQKSRGPDIAHEIPQALYEKAQRQQDQLTDDERALLLSRGDVWGKALAHPASLTLAERYKVLNWPPPDEVHARIRRATKGAMSLPAELYVKAREARVRGELGSLSDEEVALIAQSFCEESNSFTLTSQMISQLQTPGNREANALLRAEEGIDMETFGAVGMYWLNDPAVVARRNLKAERAREEATEKDEFRRQNRDHIADHRSYVQNRSHRVHPYSGHTLPAFRRSSPMPRLVDSAAPLPPGLVTLGPPFTGPTGPSTYPTGGPTPPLYISSYGTAVWPPFPAGGPKKPLGLFMDDLTVQMQVGSLTDVFDDLAKEVSARWEALPEEERAVYEARSETLRLESWRLYENRDQFYGPRGINYSALPSRK